MGVTQAPAEECLELFPRDRNRNVRVMSPLVLLLAEADLVPEEGRGKKNPGRSRSSSGSEIVLTLPTEIVAVHVGLPTIHVRGPGLQLLAGYLDNDRSRSGSRNGSRNGSRSKNGSKSGDSGLQNSPKNPLQVILGVLEDTISSSGGVSDGGFCREPSKLVGQFVT